jgi:hypothetical protein
MRITGKIEDIAVDYKSGVPRVTISVNERNTFLQGIDDLKELEKLSVEIKPFRNKRSLDANAYCFVLIDKLAEKLNIPKEEIYRKAIKEIGGVSSIVCVKDDAVENLRTHWSGMGLGWQTDVMPSKLDGCTNVILYYGSSTYDTEQMSRLISNIQQDCEAVGIETKTPNEIANLLSLWGSR